MKTTFNRRRVLVAMFVLALLAVASLFLLPGGQPADPVKATFVGFSKSTNDGAPLVVLRVTNESNRAYQLLSHDNLETLFGGFRYRASSNQLSLMVEGTFSSVTSLPLQPFSERTCQVRLPKDGRAGWPGVSCFVSPKPASLRAKIQALWSRLRSPRASAKFDLSFEVTWAICDREIQCSNVLPDGTVEQPRLVLKEDRKSD